MNKNNTILGLCWATTSIAYVFSNLTEFFFFWVWHWSASLSFLNHDVDCQLQTLTPQSCFVHPDHWQMLGLQSSVCDTQSCVGLQRHDIPLGTFSRLLTKIWFSSDNATDASFSLTVCCSPQLPAAITHHVVWKPLRLTAAVYSCEVSGCLRGLHWPALPCHSLLDCSLQQGTNTLSAYCWWWFLFRAWNDVTDVSVPLLGGDLWLSSKIASEEGYLEGLLDRHK